MDINFNLNVKKRNVPIKKSINYIGDNPRRGGGQDLDPMLEVKAAKTSDSGSGLWVPDTSVPVAKLYGVVCCVNYADYFKYSLESAVGVFTKLYVVTDTNDKATEELCRKYDFVELIKTDVFYRGGSFFDKGAGINLGLSKIGTNKSNWVLIFDADIVFPPYFKRYMDTRSLNTTTLYGAIRHFAETPEEFDSYKSSGRDFTALPKAYSPRGMPIGYFQLFNSLNFKSSKIGNQPYPEHHRDASHSDLLFSGKFKKKTTLKSVRVVHLGEIEQNWQGRVTPSFGELTTVNFPYPGGDVCDKSIYKFRGIVQACLKQTRRVVSDELSAYLSEHNVYVSLTSSPSRLDKIYYPLNTLDLEFVNAILLSLPDKYRDEEDYIIPKDLTSNEKVTLIRGEHDLGPINKLIPALRYLKEHDPSAILITIDDDTAYPFGMVNEMALAMSKLNNKVVTASAPTLSFWDIDDKDWPHENKVVSEGFSGVAYKVSDIHEDTINKMVSVSNECSTCRFSDDMVHSFLLSEQGIGTEVLNNEFYNLKLVTQFTYGFGEDAIFKASGLPEFKEKKWIRPDGVNAYKYQGCFDYLVSQKNKQ